MWPSGRSVCWKDGMGPREIQLGSASISLKQLCVELVGARNAGFVHSSGLWGCIGYNYRVYPICGPFHWKRYSKNDKEMTRHVRKSPLGTHQRPHIAMLAVARS